MIIERTSIGEASFSACMQCGKCTGLCPVSIKSKLNIRRLMLEASRLTSSIKTYPPINIYERKEVWDCTTCGSCSSNCPREVKPHEVLINLRSALIEKANVPNILGDVLEKVYKYGNPWGLSRSKRAEWTQNLNVKKASIQEINELLYFVGCAASYDSRAQELAKAMTINLNKANIEFSILGNKETCCGNEVYSLGETGLFDELAEINLNLFNKHKIQEIITTSPHCFHAFKNRYKKEIQVKHYTQFFSELIDKEKITFSKKIEGTITYQDPCFLGKHNEIYDEPRKIIENIPGLKFVEFNRSKKRSVCCEGGGGRIWHEIPGERLAEKRVKEALELKADIIAVACPFCLLTFEDAVKTTGNENKIKIKDILELISSTI